MKKSLFILLINLLLLTSCGKDRSGEYYALVQDCQWIDETMMQNYLWNDQMTKLKQKDYFGAPEDFLKKRVWNKALDGKGDRFSRIIEKATVPTREASNGMSSYGFEFELITDPLGATQHNLARVLLVYPESPANEAGLKRGDWIAEVNGEQLTMSNSQSLVSGGAIRLTRKAIVGNDENRTWETTDTLSLTASRFVEKNPFFVAETLELEGHQVAYLMYNQFTTGPNDLPSETIYGEQMIQLFSQFKAVQPDAFILDLRFNPGGYLSCAVQLASLLAPVSALGNECFQLKFNETTDPQIQSIGFDASMREQNLNLNKLYVLVSPSTASASEAVINGLIPYIGKDNIILIGEKTYGKPVATNVFKNEELDFDLQLVTAYVLNSKGEANYNAGMSPTYKVTEPDVTAPLFPLGDPAEYLLNYALQLITMGTPPETDSQAPTSNTRLLYRSYDVHEQQNGLKLNLN